jgi:hypothetical protein
MNTVIQETRSPDTLGAPAGIGNAVLDEMHIGDITGAFGTIDQQDTAPRRSLRRHLMTLMAIMGPGLIVMIGDNDAGGVATYAQAGQNYGTGLLWTLVLLAPVLYLNQEMVLRLGAVSGVGHGRLILERFGKFWAFFSVGDLFILNFLTIVTEFIGINLALGFFGVSKYISVPLACLFMIAIMGTGRFRTWERAMFGLIIPLNVIMIPMLILSHPHVGDTAFHLVVPGFPGGLNSTLLLLITAIVGTTVAPWQLFFQQSNVVDKRITPRGCVHFGTRAESSVASTQVYAASPDHRATATRARRAVASPSRASVGTSLRRETPSGPRSALLDRPVGACGGRSVVKCPLRRGDCLRRVGEVWVSSLPRRRSRISVTPFRLADVTAGWAYCATAGSPTDA